MSTNDKTLQEQLCAWMDGELPADEARFLQRRLQNDPALRAQWERWQLASACLRGQPVRTMPAGLCDRVAAAIDAEPARRPRWPWLAATAAALLVAALLPSLSLRDPGPFGLAPDATLAEAPAPAPTALEPALPAPVSPVASLPSVRDFPLAETAAPKPWPRSPLVPDDRAMSDYLVRHNALMAEDGLGGFMPYVDVVAHEQPAPDEADR
jgi:anti-sigma factor RsiW